MADAGVMADALRFFKNGATVVPDGDTPVFDMNGIEALPDEEGKPTMRGWAYPNKAMYFDLDDVEVRADGWVVKSDGRRFLLKPLTSERAKTLAGLQEQEE